MSVGSDDDSSCVYKMQLLEYFCIFQVVLTATYHSDFIILLCLMLDDFTCQLGENAGAQWVIRLSAC